MHPFLDEFEPIDSSGQVMPLEMQSVLSSLIDNGWAPDDALELLSEHEDLQFVPIPSPEFLGISVLGVPPVVNAFRSAAQRKWFFANMGKKGREESPPWWRRPKVG